VGDGLNDRIDTLLAQFAIRTGYGAGANFNDNPSSCREELFSLCVQPMFFVLHLTIHPESP
jgi:hypothetical protein